MTAHVHGFPCPESPEHAARHAAPTHSEADHDDFLDTVFGEAYTGKRRSSLAEQVRAEYEAQVRSGHARGDGVTR